MIQMILKAGVIALVWSGAQAFAGVLTIPEPGHPSLVAPAAIQAPIEEKYKIPVPKKQSKIAIGTEKPFEDGKLTVFVEAVETGSVQLKVNGGETTAVKASELTLFSISDTEICTVVYLGKSGAKAVIAARCDPATDEMRAAITEQASHRGEAVVSPLDVLAGAAKGSLVNPYEGDAQAASEGHQLFLGNSCNGCHGGNGGGGMCPPLTNEVWVYGSDADTLFRLIAKGTDELQADGYARKGRENVVGPMPPYGEIIENKDDLWKIVAYIQSLHNK